MESLNNKKKFTLCELVIAVAVIAVLAAILLPSLSFARELSSRASCGTIMRTYHSAVFSYANDYNDYFPSDFESNQILVFEFRAFHYILAPYLPESGKYTMRYRDNTCPPELSNSRHYIPASLLCPSAVRTFENLLPVFSSANLYSSRPTRGGVYRTSMADSEYYTRSPYAGGGKKLYSIPSPARYFFINDAGFNDGTDDREKPYLYIETDPVLDGTAKWGHGCFYIAGFMDGHTEGFNRKTRNTSTGCSLDRLLVLY